MVLELIKMGHETPEQKARRMSHIRAPFVAMLGISQLRSWCAAHACMDRHWPRGFEITSFCMAASGLGLPLLGCSGI